METRHELRQMRNQIMEYNALEIVKEGKEALKKQLEELINKHEQEEEKKE